MSIDYFDFLQQKAQLEGNHGFDPVFMPGYLYDFQSHLVEWALRKGRGAIFADCGLGKTPMELVYAQNVVMKTNGAVLIATTTAVAAQMVEEAQKFGIEAKRARGGESITAGIWITNYERLHLFNADDFVGFVGDESSILKSFDGTTRQTITTFCKKLPYRLLATATAAPNDFTELGTSSEALGYLGYMDMLSKFFKNDLNNSATGRMRGEVIKWRLKGHAETPFWRWICSWARAVRRPSDIGFSDRDFALPALIENEHVVTANTLADGMLFALPAVGLREQRDERKRTIQERCEAVSSIVTNRPGASIVWCHLNNEGDLLEKMIPGSVQVSGRDSEDAKEEKLLGFAKGQFTKMITKPVIGAWGLNYQHCDHMTVFPSHSYEQYYQLVRRCWRFGQKRPVTVDIVSTEGEKGVLKNLQRKAAQATLMFDRLVEEMNFAESINRSHSFHTKQEVPSWLSSTN